MEIIDVNCAVGRMMTRQHFRDRDTLLRTMDDYRISRAVVYDAAALWDAWRGNAAARAIADGSDARLQACYLLRPNLGGGEMPAAGELLERLRVERPAAVRISPERDACPLTAFHYSELLDVLATLRLPVLLEYEARMVSEHLPTLAEAFPQLPFVVLHIPHRQSNVILPLLRQRANIYLDTCTLCDAGLVEEIVARCGDRRLLYGSGMPVFLPGGSLGLLLYARIAADSRDRILAGNWLALQEGISWA